jgi:hypothetical protein
MRLHHFSRCVSSGRQSHRTIACLGALALLVVFLIMFVPHGYFIDPCYLEDDTIDDMEQLLMRFAVAINDRSLFPNPITWWIDSGTLLGAIREKRILPWDKDVDISVWSTEFNAIRKVREELLDRYGLFLWGRGMCLEKHIDIMTSGTTEYLKSKIDFFLATFTGNDNQTVYRADLVSLRSDANVGDRVEFWVMKNVGIVAPQPRDNVFPLERTLMRRGKQPMDRVARSLRRLETGGGDGADGDLGGESSKDDKIRRKIDKVFNTGFIELPVPHRSREYLRRLYGWSWEYPFKWKVRCYLPF